MVAILKPLSPGAGLSSPPRVARCDGLAGLGDEARIDELEPAWTGLGLCLGRADNVKRAGTGSVF
jgi:hypothetical protein